MSQIPFQNGGEWGAAAGNGRDVVRPPASVPLRLLGATLQTSLTELTHLVGRERSVGLDAIGLAEWDECISKIDSSLHDLQAAVTDNPSDIAYKLECYFTAADHLGDENPKVAAFGRALLTDFRILAIAGLFDAAGLRQASSVPAAPQAWLSSLPRLFGRNDGSRPARSNGHSHG